MNTQKQNPLRIQFLKRLTDLNLPPKTHPYLENWAESFMKAKAFRSAEQCHSYLSALSKSTRLADWQFDQAIRAARILACDLLTLPWAESFDWETLSVEAKDPSPNHRDFLRETVSIDSQARTGGGDPTECALAEILNRSRRTLRLTGKAVATEKTYCQWISDYLRFTFKHQNSSPETLGPNAITTFLNHLVLERNVAPATHKQALNALVFLHRAVFEHGSASDRVTSEILLHQHSFESLKSNKASYAGASHEI